jgi:hypothetical protein
MPTMLLVPTTWLADYPGTSVDEGETTNADSCNRTALCYSDLIQSGPVSMKAERLEGFTASPVGVVEDDGICIVKSN